ARSHSPAAERQTVLDDANVQLAVQHDPAAPFDAPRSHCSLNGAPDCTMPSPQYRRGLTDQPAFGRLSSRILPLNVSGYAVADAPPAPWKPIVALCPFAPALIVLRYCTFISLERSWIWTWPLIWFPVSPTRFSWKSMMKVRLGLVPTVAYSMLLLNVWRSSQYQKSVGFGKLALGSAVFVVGLAPVVVPNWTRPFVPIVAVL